MKVSATVTKQEYVTVNPYTVIHELRKEWLESLKLGTVDPVLKGDTWYRDRSMIHGHYEIEKFDFLREATPEEIEVHEAFESIKTFVKWKT